MYFEMKRLFPILLVLLVASLQTGVIAQFFNESTEYQNLAKDAYVDVFFEFSEHESGTTGSISDGKQVPMGLWDSSEKARKRMVCQSPNYKVIANLEKPSVEEFLVGDHNFFSEEGMVLQVIDKEGNVYSSQLSPLKARQNTWRAGIYFTDAHLLDFQLASAKGDTLPLEGEFVINAYPEKLHIEGRLKFHEKHRN